MRFCQQQKTRELFHYCITAYTANPQIGYAQKRVGVRVPLAPL